MDYPVYCEGQRSGAVSVCRMGEDICFDVSGKTDGLYRAWIEGEWGELPLGIMENGRLRRRFSPQLTNHIGKPVCARIESLSKNAGQWRAVRDGEFRGWQLPSTARCRAMGNNYELALRYDERRVFPLLPLFCFAKIVTMDGQRWVIFRFDSTWQPIMREN